MTTYANDRELRDAIRQQDPLTHAQSAIEIMTAMAQDFANENRNSSRDKRTYVHVVDATPDATGQPRIRLLVVCAYTPQGELMAFYGNSIALERHPYMTRTHFEYGCLYEGCLSPIGLTLAEATALLETRELPRHLRPVAPAPVEQDDAFWASLNRPDRHDNGSFAAARSLGLRRPSTVRLLPKRAHRPEGVVLDEDGTEVRG